MTNEEIQTLCDKVQGGYKTTTVYPVGNRFYKGRLYYDSIFIDGVVYNVNAERKLIIIEDVEL